MSSSRLCLPTPGQRLETTFTEAALSSSSANTTPTLASATLDGDAVDSNVQGTVNSTPVSAAANSSSTTSTANSLIGGGSSSSSSSSPNVIRQQQQQQQQMWHISIQVPASLLDSVGHVTTWISDALHQVVETLNRSYIARSVVERVSVLLLLLELGRNHITLQLASLIENHIRIHQYQSQAQYSMVDHVLRDDEQHYNAVSNTVASSASAMHYHDYDYDYAHYDRGSSSTLLATSMAEQQQQQQASMMMSMQTNMPMQYPMPLPQLPPTTTTCLVWIFPLLTAIASCCLFFSLFVHSIQSIQRQQQQQIHHYHRQYSTTTSSNNNTFHHASSLSSTTTTSTESMTAVMGIGLCTILVVLQCLVPLLLLVFLTACALFYSWQVADLFSPEMAAQVLTLIWILSAIGSGYLQCLVYTTFGLEESDE